MEGHDFNILSLIGIGLFCELEHSLPHAVIIVILLELNTIVPAPWVNMIGIIIAPNTLGVFPDSFLQRVATVDDTEVSIKGIMRRKIATMAER